MGASTPTLCILGCGGFIGSHLLTRVLRDTDWRVYGVDRDASRLAAQCKSPNLTYANIDIVSADSVRTFVEKSDIVISLVALCNPSLYNTIPLEVIDSNFSQPLQIVDLCARLHKRLIYFSTCEVYGTTVSHAAHRPFTEDTDVFVEDKTPMVLGPISAQRWSYACAKQLLERALYAYGVEQGLDYSIVRPFNFVGPRMDFIPGIDGTGVPRVIACFMDALLSERPLLLVDGGNNMRAFTYINDAVDAIMAILSRPKEANRQVFNIGNPANEISIKGLAYLMIELYRELKPDAVLAQPEVEVVSSETFYGAGYEDSDRRVPDITKAKSLLSWEPKTALRDALLVTIESYIRDYGPLRAHREAI